MHSAQSHPQHTQTHSAQTNYFDLAQLGLILHVHVRVNYFMTIWGMLRPTHNPTPNHTLQQPESHSIQHTCSGLVRVNLLPRHVRVNYCPVRDHYLMAHIHIPNVTDPHQTQCQVICNRRYRMWLESDNTAKFVFIDFFGENERKIFENQ